MDRCLWCFEVELFLRYIGRVVYRCCLPCPGAVSLLVRNVVDVGRLVLVPVAVGGVRRCSHK